MTTASPRSGPTRAQKGRLMTLSFREREVLMLRLGLFSGDPPRSVAEVAALFKVARSRIRKIEIAAMRKLEQRLEQDVA